MYNSQKLKHATPTGATSAVEYMAICECNKNVVWLRQLLHELRCYDMIMEPTVLFGDNEAANKLCKEEMVTPGNKYIRQAYHWNKECEELGDSVVKPKRTALMLADIYTKPLNAQQMRNLCGKVTGYVSWQNDP